jgi:hypothetical protein
VTKLQHFGKSEPPHVDCYRVRRQGVVFTAYFNRFAVDLVKVCQELSGPRLIAVIRPCGISGRAARFWKRFLETLTWEAWRDSLIAKEGR